RPRADAGGSRGQDRIHEVNALADRERPPPADDRGLAAFRQGVRAAPGDARAIGHDGAAERTPAVAGRPEDSRPVPARGHDAVHLGEHYGPGSGLRVRRTRPEAGLSGTAPRAVDL